MTRPSEAEPEPAHDATQTTTTDLSGPLDDVSALPGVLGTIDVAIARLESVLLAVGVLLMALNTVANVVGRYLLGSSIYFSEELNRILIILITFAGISYAARHGRHIRMSAIYDALPPKARRVMMIAIAAVTAICMMGLAWYSFGFIRTSAGQGRLLPSLQIPVWWTLVWVPLGFALTGIQYALTAYKNVVEDDIYLSTNVLEGYGTDEERGA